ncbi:MAG: DNA replication and repair protein RecF [Opitutaceae bacterium]|nr:DNA replication and repair protein RecF [Cytophagales bacterium]
MHLKSLQLLNFKNHTNFCNEFSEKLNLITGPNGTGKTNLLDAIHFICNTKSAFISSDNLAIQHEQDFFRIEGHFNEDQKNIKVECVCQQLERKLFLVDNKQQERLANYIGRFPVVLVSPYDTDIIREGSEIRRRYFDLILCQSNQKYLEKLMSYNRLLKQRNALLKQFSESGKTNKSLLSVYDEQLLPLNNFISIERRNLVNHIFPLVINCYKSLAGNAEEIQIGYESDCLTQNFNEKFLQNIQVDLSAQRTTTGIHTDEYEFKFNQTSLKKFGSQGQQKTFILALKLAHFAYIDETKQIKPLLLLDDIFDRLDEKRVVNLANLIDQNTFGQVFITDSTPTRMTERFGNRTQEIAIFKTA